MRFEKYQNTLPYERWSEDLDTRMKYNQESARLRKLFFDDMAEDLGYTDNPKRGRFEQIVWEEGHSSGYQEVYSFAVDLVDLIL